MQTFTGANAVRQSRTTTASTTSTSSNMWSSLKRILLTAHFVVLAFLWDGSLDLVCPTAYAQIRGGGGGGGGGGGVDGAASHHKSFGIGLPKIPSINFHPEQQPRGAEHVLADVHDPLQHHDEPHHVGNAKLKEGRSSDAGARHAELLHTLDTHKKANTMPTFHQSYSAGPPRSPFWNVLNGRQTKVSDLRPDPTEIQKRPLLSVVMILKNEAQSVAGMIESLVGVVDRYTIIDTGSTDRTKAIIRESFGDIPGDIYDEPFVDFATTRNRAIELEGLKSVFVLMLSGDEYLRDGMALRRFCEEHRSWDKWTNKGAAEEAYNLRVLYGHDVYDSTRLHRTDARWFYVGVTHEYMTNANKRVAIKRATDTKGMIPKIFHDLSTSDPVKKRKRWSIDRDLLLQEWEKKPNRTRTAFYLAQSYECLGDFAHSFQWYQTRWDLKGWNEEAYEARFRMARVSRHLHYTWPESQQMYLSAHAYLPKRIEPLYAIGHYYYHEQFPRNYQLAFIFLHRASMIPFPTNLRLFLDKTVYDFKVPDLLGIVSYYTGDNEVGRTHVIKALKIKPTDKRLLKNLQFFNQRLGRSASDQSKSLL
jgi:glycosyltransferase involved in cell wall biosynthesis